MNEVGERVSFELVDSSLVIRIQGDLDHHCEGMIRITADSMLDRGKVKDIVFDFTDAEFMDSSGIGLIMGRYKRVRCNGGRLVISGAGKNILRIMGMSGMLSIFEQYQDTEEALMKLCSADR